MSGWLRQFEKLTQSSPDAPALVFGGESLSRQALLEAVDRQAKEMARLPSPSRITIQSRESDRVLVAVLAAWHSGLTPAILREETPPSLRDQIADLVQPSAILSADLISCKNPARPSAREGLIMTTSGTTGVPKVVVLPHRSIECNTQAVGNRLGLNASDRLLVSTPLSHCYGLTGGCLLGLWFGATVCLHNPATPPSILQRAIRQQQISIVQGPPAFFRLFEHYWSGEPFDSVRYLTTGGEFGSPGLADSLIKMFPNAEIDLVYGMTEVGSRLCHSAFTDPNRALDNVGKPFDHIDWKIVDGRLHLKSEALFMGYLQEDGSLEGLDENGFFPSHDLVEDDGQGAWLFKGRTDSVFKVGGKQVNPHGVESVLLKISGVADAYCRPVPHSVLGSVPEVELVLEPRTSPSREEILKHCRQNLEAASVPRKIAFVEQIGRPGQKRSRRGDNAR